MAIKPIPTFYDEHYFRSRTEARWAVFFNQIGISWQYEHEGYEVASGVWYLPDFYLPEFDVYIEIKGTAPDKIETKKAQLMSNYKPCIVFVGLPGDNAGTAYLFGKFAGDVEFAYGLFGGWSLTNWDWSGNDTHPAIKTGADDLFVQLPDHDDGYNAILSAKQARFEHGQKP